MSNRNIILSHAAIYAIGNIAQKIVGIIMLPIYTQLLTPADYGVVGLLTFAVSLAEIVLGVQLVQAVPKYFHDENELSKKNMVVCTGLLITFIATLVVTVALVLARETASFLLFESRELSFVVGLFSLLLVNQAVQYHGFTFIRLREKPWLFTSLSLAKLVTQLSLNIYFVVFLELGVLGVAISAAISSSIFAITLFGYTIFHTGIKIDTDTAKKMVRFCWPLWVGSLAALYYGSSNRYYMNEFSTLTDVGLFELAAKITTILSIIVWQPFNQVWQSERFKIYKKNDRLKIYQKVFTFVSTALIFGCFGLSLFAKPIIQLMADEAFLPAALAVPCITLATALSCLVAFFNFSFHITEKTKVISRNNYISAFAITIPYILFIPKYGFLGAAIATALGAAFHLALTIQSSKKAFNMRISLTPIYLISGFLGVTYWLSGILVDGFSLSEEIVVKLIILTISGVLLVYGLRKVDYLREDIDTLIIRVMTRRNQKRDSTEI